MFKTISSHDFSWFFFIFGTKPTWLALGLLFLGTLVRPYAEAPFQCLLHMIFKTVCKMMIKYFDYNPVKPKRRLLHVNKKILVVDLRALVHLEFVRCTCKPRESGLCGVPFDFEIEVPDYQFTLQVYKRPFLDHFLESVAKMYSLVIYTEERSSYATTVLDYLDADRHILERRLLCYRISLLYSGPKSVYISMGFPHLKEFLMVDATTLGCCNHIYIKKYTVGEWDMRLRYLLIVLDCLRFVQDVDAVLKSSKLLAWCLKCLK
ncbi:CTD nuclear envelope phosphatase 1-like [Drosophila subobscura]|uniref:CTD nuclear envelope phosphatase 1-like n=1 Tax=Drosophila subobscura TaxID=7241 RepID=UPI00155A0C0A|nr:CTD nuclear envelope phosphatase 1-like [Drosophila subobscura]